MNFSKRLNLFGDEIFAALNERRLELEKQGKKIYNMSVGTPDFHTPDHIKKALMEAAADDQNWRYSLRDLPELLDAVCAYYKKRFHVEITPDMVMSVYGSQEGMGHLGMTLCDEGDVVLLPDPCYPVFAAGSKLGGAVPYYYPLVAEHDFLPYVKDIPEDVARKARYMVVSLPSNPVGSIATPGLYEEIVAFAKKYDILIIHDNAYSDIIFDGVEGGSFLATPGAREVGVEFFSLSKSFNVTGARISFLIEIQKSSALKASQPDRFRYVPNPIQKLLSLLLEGPLDSVKNNADNTRHAVMLYATDLLPLAGRSQTAKELCSYGQKLPGKRTDSMAFCMELMEKAGVIVTPGASFWSSWGRICALRAGTSTRENQRGCGIYPYKWNLSTTSKFIFKYIASFNKPYTTRFARYGSNRQKLTQTSALGFD